MRVRLDTQLCGRHLLQVVSVFHRHLPFIAGSPVPHTLLPVVTRLYRSQVLARRVKSRNLVAMGSREVPSLRAVACVDTVGVLAGGFAALVRVAVVLVVAAVALTGSFRVAHAVLVPTQQPLLLVFLPSMHLVDVFALPFDNVLPARVY
mmetsp:Transcript_18256/g.24382  ORF Transcript_18256/g.24382 Transcript_18256/m.24382 type:complete len:149 (+) Transcript_18256:502-948(+)